MKIVNHCDRCSRELCTWQMSRFNTQDCCFRCIDLEKKHPRYQEAYEAELAEVTRGNHNYKGIGLPRDLEIQSKVTLSPQFYLESNEQLLFLGNYSGVDAYFNPDKGELVHRVHSRTRTISLSVVKALPTDSNQYIYWEDTLHLLKLCDLD